MVSSSSYDSSQFNLAAQGHRQPGSTFKTFVLTTALKQGIDPYSTYYVSKPLSLDTGQVGPLGRPHRRRGLPRQRSTCSRRRSPPTTPSSPSSTSTSAPNRSPKRRSRWGSPARSTGSRPRGSAACGSASRRWRWSNAYATLAAGGIRHDPVAIRRVVFPGRPGRASREQGQPAAGRLRSRRLRGDPAAARQHHRRHRHRRLHRLRRAGRQDRHDRPRSPTPGSPATSRTWRRVVWVGYPRVERDRNDQRPRDHGLRRHLPGRNLALALLRRRSPLRGTSASRRRRSVWAPFFGRFTARRGRRGDSSPTPPSGEERANCRAQEATGGYDPNAYAPGVGQEPTPRPPPPTRLRRRRRVGTEARESPAAKPRPAASKVAEPLTVSAGAAFALIWAGFLAYLGVLASRRRGSARRPVWAAIVAARRRLRLAPSLLSHDVYSYVDYARLGVVHGLDPYVHPPAGGALRPGLRRGRLDRTRRAPTARSSPWRPTRSPGSRSAPRSPC